MRPLLHSLPLLIAAGLWQADEAFMPPLHPATHRLATTRLHYEDDKLVVSPPEEDTNKRAEIKQQQLDDKTLKQLLKTRPYPIFVAEKVASTVQGTAASLAKATAQLLTPPEADDDAVLASHAAKAKPRIVVLGVGWGSAALLADIDTDEYDVTVVSPRNHFVFTPSKLRMNGIRMLTITPFADFPLHHSTHSAVRQCRGNSRCPVDCAARARGMWHERRSDNGYLAV